MQKSITLTVNGKSHTVVTDGLRSLLDVLREDLKLTGTKYGCGEGRCGACTVLVNGAATQSCNTPVEEVDGDEIITIEGLSEDGALHPLQQSFVDQRALQCGFCTPGMIMGALSLLMETPNASEAEIRSGLGDHICRCGTYPRILKAIQSAAAKMGENAR